MKATPALIALCERLIVDFRDVIAALERGDIDEALAQFKKIGERLNTHAQELTR